MRILRPDIIRNIELDLLKKRPLLWILRIPRALLFAFISLSVGMICGTLIPLWINPWLLTGIIFCVTALFFIFWTRNVESYLSTLFTLRSKSIIYFFRFFFFIVISFLPLLILLIQHQRAKRSLGNNDQFAAAIPLVINHAFILNHYDQFADLYRVLDTVSAIETRSDPNQSVLLDTTDVFGSVQVPASKATGGPGLYFRQAFFFTCIGNYFDQYLLNKERTRSVLAEYSNRTGKEKKEISPREMDTTEDAYKYLAALADTGVYRWLNTFIPWDLLKELRYRRDTIAYNSLLLSNGRKDTPYLAYLKDVRKQDTKFTFSAANVYLDFVPFSYSGNNKDTDQLFIRYGRKQNYLDYYEKVCRNVLNTNFIRSGKDIRELGIRKYRVLKSLSDTEFDYLNYLVVMSAIGAFFCSLMLLKSIKGVQILFRIFFFLVIALVVFCLLIIFISPDLFGQSGSSSVDTATIFVLAIFFLSYVSLLLFACFGNTMINRFQNILLPYILIVLSLSPLGFVLFKSILGDFDIIQSSSSFDFYYLLSTEIVLLLTMFLAVRKVIVFYLSPQAK